MDVFTYPVAHLFLQTREGCGKRRADGRAVRKDEVDRDDLFFDEISVEMK